MTPKKLKLIRQSVEDKFQIYRNKFGNNIVGVHVGYKEKNGKSIRRYSIVFHVSKKMENPSRKIPNELEIKMSPNESLIIPTDVIATGTLKLQSNLGSKIKFWNAPPKAFGSLGFYLVRNGRLYVCSNMHVLGHNLLRESQTYYYKHFNFQTIPDISILGHRVGFLEEAYFDYMDIGIARVNKNVSNNVIPDYGPPKGFFRITESNKKNFLRKNFMMYGNTSGFQSTQLVEMNAIKYASRYGNKLYASRLLLFSRCSKGGDSGAPIFEPNSIRLLGIVIGHDTTYTYAIPIDIILNRFNASMYRS